MAMSFSYKQVERPDKTLVKIPAIPITLFGDETFETVALLDSGADISAMPKSIAQMLGLKLEGEVIDSFGIGGAVKSTEEKVRIQVSKGHEVYNFTIPFKVILGKYDFPILLGRLGFFDKFRIIIDQNKEKVSLKRVSRG